MQKKVKNILKRVLGIPSVNQLDVLKQRGLKVGKNFRMLDECIIDDSHCWHIEIGDDVTLAPRVQILAHDASTKMHLNYAKIGNVKIGNKVFIGAGSIILPGVSIGNNVIIGAGSVVTKNIPDNSVFAGNPAALLCSIDSYLDKIRNRMHPGNCFGEEYTLRGNITDTMKEEMKDKLNSEQIGFVI